MVRELQVRYAVSERRACSTLGFPRASHRYRSIRDDRANLRIRLRDLAAGRAHYGYRRLHILLLREGWQVNHKLIYRLYVEEGLQMRRKRPRRNRQLPSSRDASGGPSGQRELEHGLPGRSTIHGPAVPYLYVSG